VVAVDDLVVPDAADRTELAAEAIARVEPGSDAVAVECRVTGVVEGVAVDVKVGLTGVRPGHGRALDGVDEDVICLGLVDLAVPTKPQVLAEPFCGGDDVAGVVGGVAGTPICCLGPDAVGGDGEAVLRRPAEVEPCRVLVDLWFEIDGYDTGVVIELHPIVEDRHLQLGVQVVVEGGGHRRMRLAELAVGVAGADDAALPRHRRLEGAVGGRLVAPVLLALDVAGVAVAGGEGLGMAVSVLLPKLHRQSQRPESGELELGAIAENVVIDKVVAIRAEVGVLHDLAVPRGRLESGHGVVPETVRHRGVGVVRPHHAFDVEVEVSGVLIRRDVLELEVEGAPVLVGEQLDLAHRAFVDGQVLGRHVG